MRAHNHLATWSSDSPYVTVATDGGPFTNEGALMPSAISVIQYDVGATPAATATITVNTGHERGLLQAEQRARPRSRLLAREDFGAAYGAKKLGWFPLVAGRV